MSIRTRFNPLGTIGRKSLLPAGYIELEYLESTGTQYIDTGIRSVSSLIWDLTAQGTRATFGGGQINGCFQAGGGRFDIAPQEIGENGYWRVAFNTSWITLTPKTAYNEKVHVKLDGLNKKAYLNGSLSVDFSGERDFSNTNNIVIFARRDAQVIWYNCCERIYRSKISNGQRVLQDLIPALDPTGRPCMFDTVTKQPFYNQGTGEFLWRLKKDTLPSGYSRAYSVYFDGATVLDSLIPAKTGYDVEIKFNNKAVADRNMFSARKQPENIRMFYMAITNGPATHYIGRGGYVSIGLPFSTGVIKTWRSVLGKDANYGNVNSFTYTTTSPGLSELDFGISLYLGGIHDTDGRIPSAGIEMDFYRLTVKNEGSNTLLANLIPVYNVQTSTAGVYDVVNNRMLPTVMGNVRLSS